MIDGVTNDITDDITVNNRAYQAIWAKTQSGHDVRERYELKVAHRKKKALREYNYMLLQMEQFSENLYDSTSYVNQMGRISTDSINIFKESVTNPNHSGKMISVALDCSNTLNSFRGTISVKRNNVKDNHT